MKLEPLTEQEYFERIEESYRKGFLHGFGVGTQDDKMCTTRKPTWEEVQKWQRSYPLDDVSTTAPPGTSHEGK